jgi:cell division protein FtsQ
MDQNSPLLGRGFLRFDLRLPDRFVIKTAGEPGAAVPAIAPDKAPAAVPAPAAPAAPTSAPGSVDGTKTI